MSDEPAKIILGDTAISAVEGGSTRRWFGRRKDRQPPPKSHCENCGAELRGHWCFQCGQAAVEYHRSFRLVILDVLDSFINWDSKIFATIGLLTAKPWRLTNDFLAGKRVRYVHPLRLYLLASILFFFAINYWAKSIHIQTGKPSAEERAKIEEELKDPNLPPVARAAIEEALKLQSPTPAPIAGADQSASASASPSSTTTPTPGGDFGPLLQIGPEKPSTPLEKWFEKQAKEKIGEHGSQLKPFLLTLFNNLPYMMLCCVPLFAFILKILYIRRGVFYIEHLIYALHIHTFTYVSVTALVFATIGINHLGIGAFGGLTIAALWTAFAVQILLSIRKVYRQGWFFSVFKFLFGGFVYLIILVLAVVATFLATLGWS
jgi:hypothetical protein